MIPSSDIFLLDFFGVVVVGGNIPNLAECKCGLILRVRAWGGKGEVPSESRVRRKRLMSDIV